MVDVQQAPTTRGRVITYPDALRAARHRFVGSGALPMERLTADLWVSRATLYRVVGSRDRLLGDVLWQLADRTLEIARIDADADGLRGVDKVLRVARRFDEEVGAFEPLQYYLASEPEDATRVLFGATARVHRRTVAAWTDLLTGELRSGGLDPLPSGTRQAAFALVRIGESVLFGSMLAGVEPDRLLADRLRRSVLQA